MRDVGARVETIYSVEGQRLAEDHHGGIKRTLQILEVANLDVSRSEVFNVLLHSLRRCPCLGRERVAVGPEGVVVPFR